MTHHLDDHTHAAANGREQPLNENQGRPPVQLDVPLGKAAICLLIGLVAIALVGWIVRMIQGGAL